MHKRIKSVGGPLRPVVILETIEVEYVSDNEVKEEVKEEAVFVEEVREEVVVQSEEVVSAETRILYDRSFTARLTQIGEDVKDFYSELKNYILSYKGLKSRISWHFDSFNKGREKCIKIQFRGKSMYMYTPLSIEELPEKYHLKDVSDMARYEDVPTALKIKTPRALKYAKELVDILMQKMGVEQGNIPNDEYKPKYKSDDELIEMGLIKVKTTNSTFAALKSGDNE